MKQSGLFGLCVVGSHYRLKLDIHQLVKEHAVGNEELSSRALVDIAEQYELKAKDVKIAWNTFEKFRMAFPFLALKKDRHYAVICGLRQASSKTASTTSETNDDAASSSSKGKSRYRLVVMDPVWQADHPKEQFRFLTEEEYTEEFTGECLVMKRVWQLTDTKQPFSVQWLFAEILKMKFIFVQITLFVILLTIIAAVLPLFFRNILDKVVAHESISTLNALGVGIIVAIVFNAILEYLNGHFLLFAANRIDIYTAIKIFGHVIRLPIDYFERVSSGMLLKHIQQMEKIRGFLAGNLCLTFLDLCSLLLLIPFLFFFSVKLTLVVFFFMVIMVLIIVSLVRPFQKQLDMLYHAEGRRQNRLLEALNGIRTVKSLALEPVEEKAWEKRTAATASAYLSIGHISLKARSVSHTLEMLMHVTIIWLGATMVFHKQLTVGTLIAFQMLSGRVIGPLVKLVGLIHEYQDTMLSIKMLGTVVNTSEETNNGKIRMALRGQIIFENVSFRYRPDLPWAIRNFSLEIPRGGSLGIVGRSGAGKTTLVNLLQGLYSPLAGVVKINGLNLGEFEKSHFRANVGVVPQESYFFHGTVYENISLTKPSATKDDVQRAAMLAGAHEFIQSLPHGYETILEEKASNLSSGQRQRLAIARALLSNPAILIFDEATSALDPESEAVIKRNLSSIATGRTMIIITNRLAMLTGMQRILVMDKGEKVAFGTHYELLAQPGIYSQFWREQMEMSL